MLVLIVGDYFKPMRKPNKSIRLTGKPFTTFYNCFTNNLSQKEIDFDVPRTFGCDVNVFMECINSKLDPNMNVSNMRVNGWAMYIINRYEALHYTNLRPRWIGASEWRNKYIDTP